MDEKFEIVTIEKINELIYRIRGKQVMLSFDLAKIYGYTTKRFNEQVKNNIERFDDEFMFQLTKEETEGISRSKNSTLKNMDKHRGQNFKYQPYAFTEEGIYMLISVLKGELAIKQHKALIRTFKAMKDYIQQNQQFATKEELQVLSTQMLVLNSNVEEKHLCLKTRLDVMQESVEMFSQNFLSDQDIKEWTILKGQKFEANAAYIHIYSQAIENIYVIDDYPSIKTLELLSHKPEGINAVLFTDNRARAAEKIKALEVENFNAEYPSLIVKPNGETHDRYIILDYGTDNEQIYLCGTSSKDAGSKVCTIVQLNDRPIFYPIISSMLGKDDLSL